MDILNSVIHLMSKEELRNFKLFALRSHDTEDRKDLQLFDYIRKSGDRFNEYRIVKKLYGGSSHKNTYYRLRNRLLTEINKSISLLHWEKDETVIALHFLSLAMLYRKKRHFELAHYYLRKSEGKADRLDNLELLDMIYSEYIGLSFDLMDVNPESYIQKRTENRKTLNRLREIDNILAAVNYRLRRSQNLGNDDTSVLEMLQKTVDEFAQDQEIMADAKFRFRMYDAVSKILLQSRDYVSLESYLLATWAEFSSENLFNKGNHNTKLQMLTYIINALFKNDKIEASLEFVARLEDAMQEYNRMLYDKYLFFYYNSLVLNYSASDFPRAKETLETMLQIDSIAKIPQYEAYIFLNLAVSEYALRNYKAALRDLVRLRHHDTWQGSDLGFRFRVDIFELALRLEIRDYETLQYRLGQFRNDYSEMLENETYAKDRGLVDFIDRMNESMDVRKDAELVADIQAYLDAYVPDDTEIFKYGEFLRAKVTPV